MKSIKKIQGFTLIEMLVVMGILVILMTMGIAAGRFAVQRANLVQHQNAVAQVYQGLQAYYADNREYPTEAEFIGFDSALATTGVLGTYLDSASFEGGSDATFYYFVDSDNQQNVLVCASLGGHDDANEMGLACDGNGFSILPTAAPVSGKEVEFGGTDYDAVLAATIQNDWDSTSKSW
jgi:prepilin-type N-terminal cleavage/methylation domain-containing protein